MRTNSLAADLQRAGNLVQIDTGPALLQVLCATLNALVFERLAANVLEFKGLVA